MILFRFNIFRFEGDNVRYRRWFPKRVSRIFRKKPEYVSPFRAKQNSWFNKTWITDLAYVQRETSIGISPPGAIHPPPGCDIFIRTIRPFFYPLCIFSKYKVAALIEPYRLPSVNFEELFTRSQFLHPWHSFIVTFSDYKINFKFGKIKERIILSRIFIYKWINKISKVEN